MPSRPLPDEHTPAEPSAERAHGQRVGRYQLRAELGRGGMACVYRALDAVSGRELALKQLTRQSDAKRARESEALFEREFHVLAQLSHPRVIEVYDYGVDATGPYYTMELLDGGDLRERSPLPWRDACELIYDVCSSLALLHSRRLVHRDVSPRNVRCTRDGRAKLIDFGAMVPMGAQAPLVGTPPFVAPEVVHGAGMDARTDLFSLGATLYFALTGRLAYPARDFSQLLESWSNKPAPPSAMVPGLPPALDVLVLSLISLEPALRPRSAFEVMQRLSALADIEREEPVSVSKAYLVTPSLVGREETLASVAEHLERAQHGLGRGLLITGAPGLGRSRALDASALSAKMRGAWVLRAGTAAVGGEDFGAVRALALRLLETQRDAALSAALSADLTDTLFEVRAATATNDSELNLRDFSRPAPEQPALQRALVKWFVHVSKQQPLVVALDDADRADEASIAWIAALADQARTHALLVLGTIEQRAGEELAPALDVLCSRCKTLALAPLDLPQTEQLLGSLFGDVPNLALLSARIASVAAGNPRQIMELAQHLVDKQSIVYDGGSWSLPETLTVADLPASSEVTFRARVAQLGALARRLAEAQALAIQAAFTRADYARLEPDAEPLRLEQAVDELLTQQIVTSDGSAFVLAHRAATEVLCAELDPEQRKARHRALAESYAHGDQAPFVIARELLLAGETTRGLDLLMPILHGSKDRVAFFAAARLSPSAIAQTLLLALQLAAAERPLRERYELCFWIATLSVAAEDELYWQAAPSWLERLELDSGLSEWRGLHGCADPGERLRTALQTAAARYAQTPETERVYPPDEAIKLLVHYVAISIAIGARTLNVPLLRSLPERLEPFAVLSPLVAAIWQNALATCESTCDRQIERARERWLKTHEQLGRVPGADPQLVESIRYAIVFGVGLNDAAMGLDSASQWADVLDGDPMQRVSAMYLRKVVRLQQGDLDGAERCRRQAELLALQSSSRQMFTNLLSLEVGVHAATWDLTGVKQIAARIAPLAQRHPGWLPFHHLAEGHYQRLRGDLEAACQAYERCLALCTPDQDPPRLLMMWPVATAAYVETLIDLNRAPEAKARAEWSLAECARREMVVTSHEVVRALAIAEAKLGDHASAATRLDALIEQQLALGVSGLILGASYEARTRIAIWAGDRAVVERYGRLTANQYRHGRGSSLGARYERLMEEARGAGVLVLPPLSPFEATMFGNTDFGTRASAMATVVTAMSGADDRSSRSERALRLLCDARGARAGYLYLAAGRELRLAATIGDAPPDELLERLTFAFWSQQSDDLDPDTAMVPDAATGGAHTTQFWSDSRGTSYMPVLLSARLSGIVASAGVALLVPKSALVTLTSTTLISELANFLVRSGDSVIDGL